MARSFILQTKINLLALAFCLTTTPAFSQSSQPLQSSQSVQSSQPLQVSQSPPPVVLEPSELEQVAPGPMALERQKILDMILAAKEQKIGITAYLGAFKSLEDQVKAGAQEKQIKSRLESISSSLSEQLKRSKELKLQKPAPPVAASSPSPMESAGPKGSDASGSSTDKMIDNLRKKWFGGEIPDSIKKKIPPGIDPGKMDNETIKDLLKKYGQ
ncbi:MAG: hypothetical protein KIT34_02940 [Cyanobacteria bacterium TGS_CYA1]|nr:hypothetical protein [Cyanobacteria bacterium TGS_CYA1]